MNSISEEKAEALAVERLGYLIQPDKIPAWLRRSLPVLNGDTALDWILGGRINEVTERVERALRYQT